MVVPPALARSCVDLWIGLVLVLVLQHVSLRVPPPLRTKNHPRLLVHAAAVEHSYNVDYCVEMEMEMEMEACFLAWTEFLSSVVT